MGKPPGRLNRAHPLCRGLTGLYMMSAGGYAVPNAPGLSSAGGLAVSGGWSAGRYGTRLVADRALETVVNLPGESDGRTGLAKGFTVIARVRFDGAPGTMMGEIAAHTVTARYGAAQAGFWFGYFNDDVDGHYGLQLRVYPTGGGAQAICPGTTPGAWADAGDEVVAAVYRPVADDTGGTLRVYRQGRLFAETALGVTAYNGDPGLPVTFAGNANLPAGYADGSFYWLATFDRPLGDSQLMPWLTESWAAFGDDIMPAADANVVSLEFDTGVGAAVAATARPDGRRDILAEPHYRR